MSRAYSPHGISDPFSWGVAGRCPALPQAYMERALGACYQAYRSWLKRNSLVPQFLESSHPLCDRPDKSRNSSGCNRALNKQLHAEFLRRRPEHTAKRCQRQV